MFVEKTFLERIPFFPHSWLTGPPPIPVMGILKFEFHDEQGWQIDLATILSVYTGPVIVYMIFGDPPQASFVGVFRIR